MKDLIVGGYGLRNLPVGNKSDSGFVNSHSEADRRSYHRHLRKNLIWPVFKVHLSIHPVFLNFVPVGIFESSMIGKAGNFSFCQCHRQTLTNFPATKRMSDMDTFFVYLVRQYTIPHPLDLSAFSFCQLGPRLLLINSFRWSTSFVSASVNCTS